MKGCFILLCMFLSCPVFSQGVANEWRMDTSFFHRPYNIFATQHKTANLNIRAIPLDLYTQHFGFFCRQELKMQQAHIPVAFRLGSMDYCNWLEQKQGGR